MNVTRFCLVPSRGYPYLNYISCPNSVIIWPYSHYTYTCTTSPIVPLRSDNDTTCQQANEEGATALHWRPHQEDSQYPTYVLSRMVRGNWSGSKENLWCRKIGDWFVQKISVPKIGPLKIVEILQSTVVIDEDGISITVSIYCITLAPNPFTAWDKMNLVVMTTKMDYWLTQFKSTWIWQTHSDTMVHTKDLEKMQSKRTYKRRTQCDGMQSTAMEKEMKNFLGERKHCKSMHCKSEDAGKQREIAGISTHSYYTKRGRKDCENTQCNRTHNNRTHNNRTQRDSTNRQRTHIDSM